MTVEEKVAQMLGNGEGSAKLFRVFAQTGMGSIVRWSFYMVDQAWPDAQLHLVLAIKPGQMLSCTWFWRLNMLSCTWFLAINQFSLG
jgi:hypothetical protein